jgi:hypothetical protein
MPNLTISAFLVKIREFQFHKKKSGTHRAKRTVPPLKTPRRTCVQLLKWATALNYTLLLIGVDSLAS